MAIVRVTGEGGLERLVGLKAAKKAAKKGAKGAMEKHAGKKAAKKAPKKATKGVKKSDFQGKSHAGSPELARAFHHLQRAAAVVSLLEPESGGELRQLLMEGVEVYRAALLQGGGGLERCAVGLARAAEHLAMAGFYRARVEFRVELEVADKKEAGRLRESVEGRLAGLVNARGERAQRLVAMARELAWAEGGDEHLRFELAMAADGLCVALEEGI